MTKILSLYSKKMIKVIKGKFLGQKLPDWSKREADWESHIKPKDSKLVKVENIDWAATEEDVLWEIDGDDNDYIIPKNEDKKLRIAVIDWLQDQLDALSAEYVYYQVDLDSVDYYYMQYLAVWTEKRRIRRISKDDYTVVYAKWDSDASDNWEQRVDLDYDIL